jgi:hypothetical protein
MDNNLRQEKKDLVALDFVVSRAREDAIAAGEVEGTVSELGAIKRKVMLREQIAKG